LPKSNRAIIVAESDPHGGHKLGLLNPEVRLEDEERRLYQPRLTETQENLWRIRG